MALPRVEGFICVEKIGAGSYATVYKGYRNGLPRECVAIKCIERSSLKGSAVDNLITEIRLLKSLSHQHVVAMKEFLWDDKNVYIIMEYCNFGDLSKYVKREKGIHEMLCKRLLRQLAMALRLLREKGVVHMDLKPQNLLLHKTSQGKIILKVGDFGFAQYMTEETKAKNMRGSPLYMAPEVFSIGTKKTKEDNLGYDASVDLWSVGIILYECLFGKAPYSSSTYKELVDKILSQKSIEIPSVPKISSDCKDLLSKLLQHDPKERMSYEEFFQHPFLDMKHMPSPENYKKAVDLVQQAIEKDSQSDYETAYHLYCESLRYFVPIVIEECGAEASNTLRNKVNGYIKRAEELKLYTVNGHLSSESGSSSETCKQKNHKPIEGKVKTSYSDNTKGISVSLNSKFNKEISISGSSTKDCASDLVISNKSCDGVDAHGKEEFPCVDNRYLKTKADFDKLYALCATTPHLQTGLDVGKDAEMYVHDGRLEEALSLYRSAISVLLKGFQCEPQGARKGMLRDKIDEWLKEAESIKTLLESREMQLEHTTAESAHREHCCLQ